MLDLLKETRVFKGCTIQELQDIANFCQRTTFKNGEYIFKAKSPAEYLYIVQEGVVELRFKVTLYLASREITIDRKFEGNVFGWSALVEPHIYTLSAIAVKDSELVRINEKDLKRLSKENHHLGYTLMKNISEIIGERFELLQKILIDFIQKDLKEKER